MRRILSASAFALLLVPLLPGPAASAHAVLLRTSPSPQSTVPASPSAITLSFSERVDVSFGGIRLFDVDGHRVDTGTARVTGSDVSLPVPHLADGSYTVTWQVASADGHPVRGGFVFYVGHPSTISPVVVNPGQGAGRAVGISYGVVRFLWYAGLFLLVGAVVFRRWVARPARSVAGADDDEVARRSASRVIAGAWVLLYVSLLAALLWQAATVAGISLAGALRPGVLREMLGTTFGHLWLVQAALTVLLLLPVVGLARRSGLAAVPVAVWLGLGGSITAGVVVVHAMSGHARTDPSPVLAVTSLAVHLLAGAVWVGGLTALVLLGLPAWRRLPREQRKSARREGVRRFSAIAIGAVAIVTLTGTVNSWQGLGSVSDLWRLGYGRAIGAKVVLMGVALVLAARHLFVTKRRLGNAADEAVAASFQVTARIEAVVLAAVVAVAAALVVMVPGRSVALRARGQYIAEHRAGAYTVQAILDPTAVGSNQVHLTYVGANGLAAAAVTNCTAVVTAPDSTRLTVAMRLISPGHFVGGVTLPAPGHYRLDSTGRDATSVATTSFSFTLRAR